MAFLRSSDARASGYVDFSLSPFEVVNLLDGLAFPGYAAHQLQLYDINGNRIQDNAGNDLLYLPFIDFECLQMEIDFPPQIQFVTRQDPRCVMHVHCVYIIEMITSRIESGYV